MQCGGSWTTFYLSTISSKNKIMLYYNRHSLNRYSDLLISLTCEGIFEHLAHIIIIEHHSIAH